MRVIAFLVAVSALVVPAPAIAATWSAPQDISRPHLFATDPTIAFGGDGVAVATWQWVGNRRVGGRGPFGPIGAAEALRARGSSAFGPESPLAPAMIGPPALLPHHRLAVLVEQTVSVRTQLDRVRVGRQTIATQRDIVRPSPAGDARGDLAVVWFQNRGVRNDLVYVALRRAGHRFGRPIVLGRGRLRNVAAAVGPRGDVLVAWEDYGVIRTRLKLSSRHAFGRVSTIRSRQRAFGSDLRAVVDGSGRAYVAWTAQFRSEGGDQGPVFVEAAVRPAGARGFRPATLLDRLPNTTSPHGIALADDGDRTATVAWGSSGGIRTARIAGSRIGAPASVPGTLPTDVVTDLAAGRFGSAIAAIRTDPASDVSGQVLASLAPVGGAFGAPETVTPMQEANSARVAFDPTTRQPTLVWSNRPQGSRHPLRQIRTVIQAATRI